MNKFKKRFAKLVGDPRNAVVIGQGFGQLENLLQIFQTVFVFSWEPPTLRAKNLIFRENLNDVNLLLDISAIFIDIDQLQHLESISHIWNKNTCAVLIEGNDPIGREFSKPLYRDHYRCTDQQENYHVWRRK